MKSSDQVAAAFAQMWKETRRKIGSKQGSAWSDESLKGRLDGIEDCAHAAGIFPKFKEACAAKGSKDIPGQMLFDQVPGFAVRERPRED